jgi:DNA-binding transcriptional regulator GbsR (MarR family)
MDLSVVTQKFILHWSEMGSRWGMSPIVAQTYALLYLSADPLNAQEIAKMLSVARSNVRTGLHELQGQGIIKTVHVYGDRRDHFAVIGDVWETFQKILDKRRRREVDPTLQIVQACVAELDEAQPTDTYIRRHLLQLLDFLTTMISLYDQIRLVPADRLRQIVKPRGKLKKLLAAG